MALEQSVTHGGIIPFLLQSLMFSEIGSDRNGNFGHRQRQQAQGLKGVC